MGGSVELPQVWAFQADDRALSVPRPVVCTTEGDSGIFADLVEYAGYEG